MIFEFFKRLFWKADEGGRKRKASDSVFHSEEEDSHSKKRCHDFVSSNHIKIMSDSSAELINTNTNYCSNPVLGSKTKSKAMDPRKFDLTESPIDWSSTIKTGSFGRNNNDLKKVYTSLQKNESRSHQLTLYKTHRLAERKQYSEMLLNFVPIESQMGKEFRKNISQDSLLKVDLCENDISPIPRHKSSRRESLNQSYKQRFFINTPSLQLQKQIKGNIGTNNGSSTEANNETSDETNNERSNETRNETSNEKMESNRKSINRTPIEVIKTNTLRDELLRKEVMKQDFLLQISKRYNERLEQRNKEAEELKKMTHILSKHNRLTREATLEEFLNRSMRLCEAVLDESDADKESKLPELDSDMIKKVERALSSGAENQVLVEGFGLKITRRDIHTLAGLNWLNDEVINFYMNLLITRGNEDKYPSVYAMNTFFYPKLVSSGHASLKRWTRKVDIFAKDLVVVPIHLGIHWCMSVIDLRNKSIQYYDSMGADNNKCLQVLRQYLCDESIDKKKKPFDLANWTFECVKDIPQQMNGSDCGVFSCMFAEYICANKSINFSQEDMPYFRNKMVYEILTSKLL